MTLRIRVQPAHGDASEHRLEGAELIVGRATTASIVIPDHRVSRQHARFLQREGAWWVEDLGARNRTLLNGVPLEHPEKLRAGDRLQVGDAVLRVIGDSEAPDDRDTGLTTSGGDRARMWTINEIHRAIAGPLSVAELLDLILARCFDVLNPEEGVIMLRGPDGALATATSRRRDASTTPVVVPRRLVDEVVGKVQPALVDDAAYDERFAGSASIISSGLRSIVAAPIVDAEGTLGLIMLCSRVAVRRFTQPDLEMLLTIASAAALRVRNLALAEALAARRIVEHELEVAHEVQMAMLPRTMPAYPGLTVSARLKPAHSVGGDLYDVALDADRLWFIVADVAGKSIAAALYMAITKALFRATAHGTADVSEVATRMNEQLARDNDRMMFVTALVGCLDLQSGSVSLVDAGHNPAMLASRDALREILDIPKGTALGVIEHAAYTAARFTLSPHDTLILYTDGLTDARSPDGEMFGEDRVREAMRAVADTLPGSLVAHVIAAVERFAGAAPPEDDLTLLALRYAPAS
ncbi:MAG TPA: SpoIIE family protein phosphatase [Vicinamibacterales bacterium]|nr:SpoIIE family protein phosphatase [Vicinamibacterales bacterium]